MDMLKSFKGWHSHPETGELEAIFERSDAAQSQSGASPEVKYSAEALKQQQGNLPKHSSDSYLVANAIASNPDIS